MKHSTISTDKTGMILSKINDIEEPFESSRTTSKAANLLRNPLIIWGFCLFVAFIYLLICTKSSPLYPFNDWIDANASFTMGKGMMNGKVLYRDLFEQKGPLIYFIHGLSYLISARSFLGVFVFEVISFAFFLFFSFKSLSLFMDRKYSLIFLPLITTLVLNLKSFAQGDSAEEFGLPLMAISLYYLLRYFKKDDVKLVSFNWIFWNGVIAGCVLWIKFSMLGFWIGWMAALIIVSLAKKQPLNSLRASLLFLAGMFAATLPWLVYFGLNDSIPDWINTYFFINILSYQQSVSLIERLRIILSEMAYQIAINPVFGALLWLGIIVFVAFGKFLKNRIHRISLLLCVLFLVLGIYGGGRAYIYYYLIVSPLIIFGAIVLYDLIPARLKETISLKSTGMVILAAIVTTMLVTLQFNQNVPMLKVKKEDLVQYKYAKIINQTENATLLNYGWVDLGFYTTTGITPNVRFFDKLNFDYSLFPLNVNEQNRYIKEKVVDYVVIPDVPSDSIENWTFPDLFNNYHLVAAEEQKFEDSDFIYYLFMKTD